MYILYRYSVRKKDINRQLCVCVSGPKYPSVSSSAVTRLLEALCGRIKHFFETLQYSMRPVALVRCTSLCTLDFYGTFWVGGGSVGLFLMLDLMIIPSVQIKYIFVEFKLS